MKAVPASALKKRRILESARALLVKRGFAGFTLDDVAKKAGVAKGTLFVHYENKEDLLAAAYMDLSDSLGESLDRLAASPFKGLRLLHKTAEALLIFLDTNSDFLLQIGPDRFHGCRPESCRLLTDKVSSGIERLSKILRIFSRTSGVRLKDYRKSSCAFFGLCRASMFYRLVAKTADRPSSRARQVVDFLLNGAKS